MEYIYPMLIVAIILIVIPFTLYFIPLGHWFAATLSGVRITLLDLILMRLRKSPVQDIVQGMITAAKAGISINRYELEAHSLAGGNIVNVINGLVAAKNAKLSLSFKIACSSDLKGIDLVKAVNKAIELKKKG